MIDNIKQELEMRNKLVVLPKKQELKIKSEMSVSRITDIISDKLIKHIEDTIANTI